MKNFVFIMIIFPIVAFAKMNTKVPKPEIREFDVLRISDLTQRLQINVYLGGDYWYWNNLNKSEFKFKLDDFSLSLDKYKLFYKGYTTAIKFDFENDILMYSIGYKVELYGILYSKFQLQSVLYPYFDLGMSFSLGLEFSLFNLLRVFSYNEFAGFIFNGRNLTSLYLNYYLGVGVYF